MIKQKNTDIFLIIYPQQKIPWKTLKNHHSPVSNGSTIALDSGSPETPEPARFRITNPSPGGWWFGRLGSTWIHFLGWLGRLGRLGRLGLSIYDDLCNTADDWSFFFWEMMEIYMMRNQCYMMRTGPFCSMIYLFSYGWWIVIVGDTWWLTPMHSWVIFPVISRPSRVSPVTGVVITHLLPGMSHEVPTPSLSDMLRVSKIQHTWLCLSLHRCWIWINLFVLSRNPWLPSDQRT